MNLEAFFAMGGYAFYVWSAYGLALTVLMVNLVATLWRHKQVMLSLGRLVKKVGPR